MWEHQRLTTLRASTACYTDIFTLFAFFNLIPEIYILVIRKVNTFRMELFRRYSEI
jgi:hypothetical protein